MDQLLGAALHTPEAVHALIINGIDHLPGVQAMLIIDPIHTLAFHTNRAIEAAFLPCDDA
jgi:hypothetical protein